MIKELVIPIVIILMVLSISGCVVKEKSAEEGCLDSGGRISTSLCCKMSGNYPDTCKIGPCVCAPINSHEVKVCDCGEGRCFNGVECVFTGTTINGE